MTTSDGIPISRPSFTSEEAEAVTKVLESAWVSQGPVVAKFERLLASYVVAPHAIATSSCTTALHLALVAIDLRPGDEVILPSQTFIATANVVRHAGGVPVFVDIDPRTFNSGPEHYAEALTKKTRAILCVHQMGMPCDVLGLIDLLRGTDVVLIEDAACALGSEVRTGDEWSRIGAPHGTLACFSFHGRKIISTGEGGMITTRDGDMAGRLRRLRQHGMSISDLERHSAQHLLFETYDEVGFNYRLSDLQGAVGSVQMTKVGSFARERRRIAALYAERLEASNNVEPPFEPAWARTNWQSYCVRLPKGVDQTTVLTKMRGAGIAAKRAIMCIHREKAYVAAPEEWRQVGSLIESESAQDQAILLPMFNGLSEDQIDRTVSSLLRALAERDAA